MFNVILEINLYVPQPDTNTKKRYRLLRPIKYPVAPVPGVAVVESGMTIFTFPNGVGDISYDIVKRCFIARQDITVSERDAKDHGCEVLDYYQARGFRVKRVHIIPMLAWPETIIEPAPPPPPLPVVVNRQLCIEVYNLIKANFGSLVFRAAQVRYLCQNNGYTEITSRQTSQVVRELAQRYRLLHTVSYGRYRLPGEQ